MNTRRDSADVAHATGEQIRRTVAIAMRVKAAVLAIVAAGIGILSWVVLGLIHAIARDQEVELAASVQWWLDSPWVVALLAIPAIAVCVAGTVARRGTIGLILLSLLFSLLPLLIVLYCFVSVLAPLYRYESV